MTYTDLAAKLTALAKSKGSTLTTSQRTESCLLVTPDGPAVVTAPGTVLVNGAAVSLDPARVKTLVILAEQLRRQEITGDALPALAAHFDASAE